VLSAALAWAFLGQGLSAAKVLAMVATLAGIALVVLGPDDGGSGRSRAWGLTLALGATLGQSVGQFTAFKGMAGGVGAFPALTVRIAAGALGSLGYLALSGRLRFGGAWRGSTLAQILVGTALGPLAGGFLALYSLTHAPLGLASTLLSVVPIFLLPLSRIFFHEPITPRAVAGTLLTVGGAAGLFLLR
jgi:drug/metabolite transporter (DMT)-like permease